MDVTHLDESGRSERDADVFVSTALHHDVFTEESAGIVLSLSDVQFEPGQRTRFHTHPNGQILYITDGEGIVGTEDERRTVTPGDAVYFPPGENHWHGAAADTGMTHLSFLAYEGESGLDSIGGDPSY